MGELYPNWLRRCLVFSGVLHDLAIICMGFYAFGEPPRTILAALNHESVRNLWGIVLIVGGVLALVGILSRNLRFETTGCVFTAAGKLVWMVAALSPIPGITGTEVLATALFAGAMGTTWRFFALYAGSYLRART